MQYLFVDCEASGLFSFVDSEGKPIGADAPGQPRLAQLGLVFVGSDCEIQSQHEFLIRPRGWMMSPEAERVTGLTTAHLEAHGVPIEGPLRLYQSAIESRRIVSGFNVSYDLKVMRAEMRHANRPDLFMTTKSMCLMSASRPLVKALDKNGRTKQPKLEEACAHFGIEQPGAHSALADAMSAYQIWRRVIAAGVIAEIKDPYEKKPKKKPKRRGTEEEDEIGLEPEILL